MIRAAVASVFLALAALPAWAQTATIRSGEHETYSRIVVEPGAAAPWVLGRTGAGYELRFDRAGLDFDTSRIYARIPRSRLAEVMQAGDARLALTVAPDHHVRAFETERGVVVDVYRGPAPEGSRFELPLPPLPEPAEAPVVEAPAVEIPVAGPVAEPPVPAADPAPPFADPALAGLRPRSRPEVVAALASAAAAMRDGGILAGEPPVAAGDPPPPEVPANGDVLPPGPPAPATTLAEPAPAVPLPALPVARYRPEPGPDPRLELYWRSVLSPEAEAHATPEVAAAPMPAPVSPALPPVMPVTLDVNPRVAASETELLRQLSRAASQGLVRTEVPDLRPAAVPSPQAPEPAAVPADEAPARSLADHLNVRSRTSIDRELGSVLDRLPVTADGRTCLPDTEVDIGSWGDGRPMLIQLVEAREGLVGEFDRPDPDVALRLAKLYLHFGFGAEARQTLEVFGAERDRTGVLAEMAAIMDYGQADPDGILSGMIDCDTAAALWGMLARGDLGPGDTVDEAAAFRAFSALPLHLRQMLGETLAERFLKVGAPERARAVRDAILRAPGEHGLAISMINARLELAEGDLRAAETHLADVAQTTDPKATEALILYVEGRLADDLPVDRAMVENAGALAFAMKGAPEAPALERAQVLGLASNGDFAEAFAALARWREDGYDPLQPVVKDELFAMLAAPELGEQFLTHYFANRDLIRPEEASADLRLALSERLLSFSFTDEARRMRGPDAATTETGRLFLARAALADYDGAEALRQLDGFDGTEARRLRADALRLLGRHDEAAAAYLAAGAPDEAGSEAWRAGDWQEVAELDAGLRGEAVTAFGLVPGVTPVPLVPAPVPGPDGEAPGPLAINRALIEESRAARELIDALLADAGEVAPAN